MRRSGGSAGSADAEGVAVIPVLAVAGDGPVVVWHTPEEWQRFMAGVDVETSWLMVASVEGER